MKSPVFVLGQMNKIFLWLPFLQIKEKTVQNPLSPPNNEARAQNHCTAVGEQLICPPNLFGI